MISDPMIPIFNALRGAAESPLSIMRGCCVGDKGGEFVVSESVVTFTFEEFDRLRLRRRRLNFERLLVGTNWIGMAQTSSNTLCSDALHCVQ